MTRIETHIFDSGVYFDTYPGEAISCCEEPMSSPVHDVPCGRCGRRRSARHECPSEKAASALGGEDD